MKMSRNYRKIFALTAATALPLSLACVGSARAAIAGVLDCDVPASQAVLIGSQREVRCLYRLGDNTTEGYAGTLVDAGLELGQLAAGKISYNVYTLLPPRKADLEGAFIGGGIGGSVGLERGLRADNLIGGPANGIVMQPETQFSTQSTGLNVSVGVRTLTLHHVEVVQPTVVDESEARPLPRHPHKKRS